MQPLMEKLANQTGLDQINFGGEFVEDGSVFYYKDSFKGLKGYISR